MKKQIVNPGIRFARSAKGPYTTNLGNGIYARAITTRPLNSQPSALLQESGDNLLQENSDKILLERGNG